MKTKCLSVLFEKKSSLTSLLTVILVTSCIVRAQTVWDGSGANNNWSNTDNWSTDASPEATDVQFGDTDKTTSSVPNNSVDQDFTLNSLSYLNTGSGSSDWQYTEIGNGLTLTLDTASPTSGSAIMTVGGYNTDIYTLAKIGGEGTFTVNESTMDIWVSNRGGSSTDSNRAVLDMSELATFNATVNQLLIGTAATGSTASTPGLSESSGQIILAQNNTITTSRVAVGSNTNGQNKTSSLVLGQNNTINADDIIVGGLINGSTSNVNGGQIYFNSNLEPGSDNTVTIRGSSGGVSRANLTISEHGAGTTNRGNTSTVDFTDGSVDAMINNLEIAYSRGQGTGSANGKITGYLLMDEGSMDVTTAVVGRTLASGSGNVPSIGNLSIGGGTFTSDSLTLAWNSGGAQGITSNLWVSGGADVSVDNGIVMGDRDGTATAGTVIANMEQSGGRVTLGGNLAEGSNGAEVASTLTLRGGTLDLGGNAITVDTFNALGGTLQNVGEFNSGSALTKTGGGSVLTLSGTNTYTGGTTINGGTVAFDSASAVPAAGTITVNQGAAAFSYSSDVQSILESGKVNTASTGSIALTPGQAGQSIDFSASGANMANAYLGALGDVTYTGTLTPNAAGAYRLGGGNGTLTYAADLSGSDSVTVGGGVGTRVILSGNNTYTGGTTLNAGTLRLTAVDDIGAANSALTFNGGALQWASGATGDVSTGRTVTLNAGGATLDTNGNDVTLNSGIGNSGTGGLTKAGQGTLTLTGASNYTGATSVNRGTLALDLASNPGGVIASSSALNLGGGTLSVKGASSGSSSQTFGNPTLASHSASSLVLDPNGGSGTTVTLGNTWTRNSGSTLYVDRTAGGTLTSSPTLINNVSPYIVVTDSTSTGFATVTGGNIVRNTTQSNLGATSSSQTTNFNVTGSVTRTLSSGGDMNTLRIANTAPGTLDLGTYQLRANGAGGFLMVGTADYLISNGTFGGSTARDTIFHHYGTGVLTVSASLPSGLNSSIVKTGPGTLVLSGSNSYTGATVITGGVLEATQLNLGGRGSSLGSSSNDAANVVINGATLRYTGGNATTDRSFTVGNHGGTLEASGSGILTILGSMASSATSGEQTFTLGGTNTGANALNGAITNGAGGVTSLTKAGAGQWILNGESNYTGSTIVESGTLLVNGALSRTRGVTVMDGAFLGGSGSIRSSVTVADGGTLAPGNSPGAISTEGLILQDAAILSMELAGATAGSLYDQVLVNGTIDLGGLADLKLTLSYAPSADDMFVLLDNDAFEAISGSFATINGVAFGEFNTFTLNYNSMSYDFYLSYTGGSGNDLVAYYGAVPESSTYALLLGIGSGVLWFLRRRRA